MADPRLELVSFELCPYVQRAAITLIEKGVPFERTYVDLSAKPDWFKALSPLGKVPLLKIGDDIALFESVPIVEYLDDVYAPRLHSADPIERARDRAWIEFGSSILADIWVIETTSDLTAYEAKLAQVRSKFERLEAELGDGPFFHGTSFRIIDAIYAPIFRYFEVFEIIAPMRPFADLPRLSAWRDALSRRPSVKQAVVNDYAERLIAFVAKHDGVLAKAMTEA